MTVGTESCSPLNNEREHEAQRDEMAEPGWMGAGGAPSGTPMVLNAVTSAEGCAGPGPLPKFGTRDGTHRLRQAR